MAEITILMPCLNEEETIGGCIDEIIKHYGDKVEILVADNGSEDNSRLIAERKGVRVIIANEKGYGNALIYGIKKATGKYILIGDCDGSYDFSEGDKMLSLLKSGYSLVLGNRFKGKIEKDAMPFLHKIGSPMLSFLASLVSKINIKGLSSSTALSDKVGDFHCGLRAFEKEAFDSLNICCGGMEFATEMVVKFIRGGFSVTEIPITLRKDKRNKRPHLRTFRDGFRHLLFILKCIFTK